MTTEVKSHLQVKTLHEVFRIPAHAKRRATAAFEAIRHQMIVVEDQPCFMCGVRQSTLGFAPLNPKGATSMQLHHCWIEWALADAIDLTKFNQRIVQRFRTQGTPGYERDFTREQMLDWIDHGRENLLPLCDVDHIHRETGIHEIDFPSWIGGLCVRDDFHYEPVGSLPPVEGESEREPSA